MSDGMLAGENSDTHGVRRSDELPVFANRMDMSMLSGNHMLTFGWSLKGDEQAEPVCPPILIPHEMYERLASHFAEIQRVIETTRLQRP